MTEYRICSRCVMDTTDTDITFDENGFCNHCNALVKLLQTPPYSLSPRERELEFENIVENIKKEGKNKRYDSIMGVSGGVDSTYLTFKLKEYGLRPLLVHFDNGWNSEIASNNIERVCNRLGFDLHTYVVDWEEFKDIQLSFLKASTPDAEIPTDHGAAALMRQTAIKIGTRYVLSGYNLLRESILPAKWSQGHHDLRYIKGIQRMYGTKKIRHLPRFRLHEYYYWKLIKKLQFIRVLDYIEYDKTEAKRIISEKLGWKDYGGKHCENNYTKIYQSYILPKKFGYDKRRAHFSNLIVIGQMARQLALEELKKPPYDEVMWKNDIDYMINKLGITRATFDEIMALPKKSYFDYPNYPSSFYFKTVAKMIRAFGMKKIFDEASKI